MATRSPETTAALHITVVREGGVAGMRMQWHARSAAEDRDAWTALVDACPWDAVADATAADRAARDRFVWAIEVRVARRRRAAKVPDSALTGPWRELVDRVKRADTGPGAA